MSKKSQLPFVLQRCDVKHDKVRTIRLRVLGDVCRRVGARYWMVAVLQNSVSALAGGRLEVSHEMFAANV